MKHVLGADGYWYCEDCLQSCRSDNPCDCCDDYDYEEVEL